MNHNIGLRWLARCALVIGLAGGMVAPFVAAASLQKLKFMTIAPALPLRTTT